MRELIYLASASTLYRRPLPLFEHMSAMRDGGRAPVLYVLGSPPSGGADLRFPFFEFSPADSGRMVADRSGRDAIVCAVDPEAALLLADIPDIAGIHLMWDMARGAASTFAWRRRTVEAMHTRLGSIAFSDRVAERMKSAGSLLVEHVPWGVGSPRRQERTAPAPQVLCVDFGESPVWSDVVARSAEKIAARCPAVEFVAVGRVNQFLPFGSCIGLDASAADIVELAISGARCMVIDPIEACSEHLAAKAAALGCPVVRPPTSPTFGSPHDKLGTFCESAASFVANSVASHLEVLSGGPSSAPKPTGSPAVPWTEHVKRFNSALNILLGKPDVSPDLGVDGYRVSIVIPTKNAGSDFELLLGKIDCQARHRRIELVVVDSGSTDGTTLLARQHGAKVVEIPPEDFNHGGTRNLGADIASGEFILFMTQDALPVGDDWLCRLMEPHERDPLVAASRGRDTPREDADLFTRWLSQNAFVGLDWHADKVIRAAGVVDRLLPHEKRKLTQLADTCCLVRGDAFRHLRFAPVNYAEDLDLGLRLLRHGYHIAMLHSVGIVHSHNRSAHYWLRRTYIDAKVVPEILGRVPRAPLPIPLLFWSLRSTFRALESSLPQLHLQDNYSNSMMSLLRQMSKAHARTPTGDPELAEFIDALPRLPIGGAIGVNPVGQNFEHLVRALGTSLDECYPIGAIAHDEISSCLYKVFATAAGGVLGAEMVAHDEPPDELSSLDSVLSRGV